MKTAGLESLTTPPPESGGTVDRILDAAEQLFADEGFERVSLRHLTQAAGVNLSAVNYHFGSKEALIDSVIERYITPVNEERLGRLAKLEEVHGDTAIPVRDILAAFMQPFVTRVRRSELSERLFFKLMGRCMSEPDYRLPERTMPLFHEVVGRFSAALKRTAPHLPEEVIFWRIHFTFGVLAQTMLHNEAMEQITRGRGGRPSSDEILNRILDYTTAGFVAPEGGNAK